MFIVKVSQFSDDGQTHCSLQLLLLSGSHASSGLRHQGNNSIHKLKVRSVSNELKYTGIQVDNQNCKTPTWRATQLISTKQR